MCEYYVGRWHSPEGNVTVIVQKGERGALKAVFCDWPVRLVTLQHERNVTKLDYSLKKAARKMLDFCKNGNGTKGAIRLLRDAYDAGRLPPV